MSERRVCTFRLQFGERTMEASVSVPVEPLRVADMLPLFFSFTEAVTSEAAARVEDEGKKISCRAGCGACCRQIVPISENEAFYLAQIVEEMPEPRREEIRRRFAAAAEALKAAGLLDELRGSGSFASKQQRRELGLRYFRAGVACPFLENESCGIHEHRPISCREYLVTSPAVHCSAPSAETVEMVQLAVKPSVVMYRFGDGRGEDEMRHVPLVLALEWAAAHAGDPRPSLPGPEILENFLRNVQARMR